MLCEVCSLCYVKSLVCVMLQSVLCVAFSVSGSLLKRLLAALLIPADVYISNYISTQARPGPKFEPSGAMPGPGPIRAQGGPQGRGP